MIKVWWLHDLFYNSLSVLCQKLLPLTKFGPKIFFHLCGTASLDTDKKKINIMSASETSSIQLRLLGPTRFNQTLGRPGGKTIRGDLHAFG